MNYSKWMFGCFAALSFSMLVACGGDSGSSAEEISSSSGPTKEEMEQRCYEKFDATEDDTWAESLSGNEFISKLVCESISEYMSYQLAFYARCTSANYDPAKNRFDIEVITEQRYMHIWAEMDGCSYKLGTDGDMEPLIAKERQWTLDDCLCREKIESTLYREIKPAEEEDESSSSEESDVAEGSSSSVMEPSGNLGESSSSQESVSSSESIAYKYEIIKASGCDDCDAFTDQRDGMTYRVKKILDEIWMIDDLRYSGSSELPLVGAKCPDDADCTQRGRLYTWDAAVNACPEGWTLPSNEQMEALFDEFIGNYGTCGSADDLLSATGWGKECGNASGFSAVPTGEWGYSFNSDRYARYWTSSVHLPKGEGAYMWYVSSSGDYKNQPFDKKYGYAVRCVATGDVILDAVK